MSETAKHRHLVTAYCDGVGVDLGSSGDPVVPWAMQLDLPTDAYHRYNVTRPEAAIHLRGSADNLEWFRDGALDFVHASHLLEDFESWRPVLDEWLRVLKSGGYLIIAVPDHERFRAYVQRGRDAGIDCDNLSHRHESQVGELTAFLEGECEVLMDGFVSEAPTEYSILFIGRKR